MWNSLKLFMCLTLYYINYLSFHWPSSHRHSAYTLRWREKKIQKGKKENRKRFLTRHTAVLLISRFLNSTDLDPCCNIEYLYLRYVVRLKRENEGGKWERCVSFACVLACICVSTCIMFPARARALMCVYTRAYIYMHMMYKCDNWDINSRIKEILLHAWFYVDRRITKLSRWVTDLINIYPLLRFGIFILQIMQLIMNLVDEFSVRYKYYYQSLIIEFLPL